MRSRKIESEGGLGYLSLNMAGGNAK